jgi:hypothetical protein
MANPCDAFVAFSTGIGTVTSFSFVSVLTIARVVVSKPLPGVDRAKNKTGLEG